MIKLPPIHWTHNGRRLSVCLFVEGDKVVGMTPVDGARPTSQIVVPGQQYLGDHIANGLSKLGVNKCKGCTERQELLNGVHRKVVSILG